MIVHASSNFLTVNTRRKDHPIKYFQDHTMMKNKSKKQEDEGSTQSNASRYDPYTFFYLFHICLDCLPCQAWLITCVYICDVVLLKCTTVMNDLAFV